jgi:phosphoketolase
MRPEVARGHLWPLLPDALNSEVRGYRNRGGTLDEAAMLFANSSTWAHILLAHTCSRCRWQVCCPLRKLLRCRVLVIHEFCVKRAACRLRR